MGLIDTFQYLGKNRSKLLAINLVALLAFHPVFSQTSLSTIKGHVKDAQGETMPGAIVIIEELKLVTTANEHGHYELKGVPEGTHLLTVKSLGYKSTQRTIQVSKQEHHHHFVLEEDAMATDEVTIQGLSKTQEAKEQPIKAEIIDTKAAKEQPVSLTELMDRSAGIRIRQIGGLGASTNIMLNGFQGRSIKLFKDGIPLSYLGGGFDISSVPVNMLERVEVYKGVLPVQLGADALGGAINLITRSTSPKYLELSYEYGSFNTHRATFNTFYSDTARRFFVGLDAFLNYTDNNYKVKVNAVDQQTANLYEIDTRLFNARYWNQYTEAYAGFRRTQWADELRFGLTGFFVSRQNPFGATMSQAFGASLSQQYSIVPTLRYQKSFFRQRLNIDQFLAYNTLHTKQVDTARGQYNWTGDFIPSPSRKGEMTQDGSYAQTKFTYLTSRTFLSFKLHAHHLLEFNAVYTGMTRVGSDPNGKKFGDSNRDILSLPATYNKAIFSLGLNSKLYKQLITNLLIVKYYHYRTDFVDIKGYPPVELPITTNRGRWGIAEAVKVAVSPHSFFRVSAELATRLPEQDEIFGDGNLQLSNLQLLPERSWNMNLGFRTEKQAKHSFEVNTFYRVTNDLILNVAPVNFMFSQHQNVDEVKGAGIEADANVSLFKWLRANGNFTYQDFRLFNTDFASLEGARLKNMPYFFANLGLNAQTKLFSGTDKLQFYYYYSFVREYYLDYIPTKFEPNGFLGLWGKAQFDAPNIVPNQHLHSVGFNYSFIAPLSIGFQVKNLWDASIYNNFRVQNPGRSFHVKLNYLFK